MWMCYSIIIKEKYLGKVYVFKKRTVCFILKINLGKKQMHLIQNSGSEKDPDYYLVRGNTTRKQKKFIKFTYFLQLYQNLTFIS